MRGETERGLEQQRESKSKREKEGRARKREGNSER